MAAKPKTANRPIAATTLGIAALLLAGIWVARSLENHAPARDAGLVGGTGAPQGFEEVVARVKPAVFGVRTKVLETQEEATVDLEDLLEGFADPESPRELPKAEPSRPRLIMNEGSGFFISPDGYAVTANHVVERGKAIKITTNDGKSYPVKVVGTDPKTDLALLKVEGRRTFPFVEIADRSPRIGEWVLAVGSPFGLGGTVTAGIVSAGARDVMAESYGDYIQIDAPVNQGNSGGPTFDADGKVIGVNSAIFSPTGSSVGIGFAIPAETLRTVVPQLKRLGIVVRGWIGVTVQDVTPEIADSLGMREARGVLVAEASAGAPASQAGIRSGDIIATLDGKSLNTDRDLSKRIGQRRPGTTVVLGVIQKGQEKAVKVRLAQHPTPSNEKAAEEAWRKRSEDSAPPSRLGVTLAPADTLDKKTEGVVVTDVEPGGIAAERGLQTGDVILEVDGKKVSDPSDVYRVLSKAKEKRRANVLARVESGEFTHFIAMPVG